MIKEVTTERVMNTLPALPRGRAAEVQRVIDALLKAFNVKNHLTNHEVNKKLQCDYQASHVQWCVLLQRECSIECHESLLEIGKTLDAFKFRHQRLQYVTICKWVLSFLYCSVWQIKGFKIEVMFNQYYKDIVHFMNFESFSHLSNIRLGINCFQVVIWLKWL